MSADPRLQQIIDTILAGSAPDPVRTAAARGALPLPPGDLARLQVHLLGDATPEIAQEARASLDRLQTGEMIDLLDDEGCAAEVLDHFAERAVREESLAEKIVFHQAVSEDALVRLATDGKSQIVELIMTNQQRLLASPTLIDRLMNNPTLRPDQRGRLIDMLSRFVPGEDGKAPLTEGVDDPAAQEALAQTAKLLDVDVGELFAASEIVDAEEFEQHEDPAVVDAYRHILTLNTAQKAILAMKGGREERRILIRDSNKVVSLSVLRNARMNEQEVETIATMRNVNDEVLRTIGTNRDWVKNYTILSALIHNPRTPPGISTNFVSRLMTHDLKKLKRDRNVPEVVRKMAKKTLDVRDQRSRSNFRKR